MTSDFGNSPEDELVPPPYEPGQSAAGEPTPMRVLRRSKTDRVLAGVAGGLGRYLGVDPVILRIAFVVMTLAGLAGVLVYIIGWIAIPEEKEGENIEAAHPSGGNTARVIAGGVLILIGGAVLLDRVIPDLGRFFWPAAIILVGAFVLFGGALGRRS